MHILPTRGRPAGLRRFFEEGRPEQPGVIVCDSDDADSYSAVDLPQGWHKLVVRPRSGYVAAANAAFAKFPNEPWYSIAGDDSVGRTPGWDTVLAAAAAPCNVVWPDDLYRQHCTQPFVGGDLCRALGWFVWPGTRHLFCDTVWGMLHAALQRGGFMPEVVYEHLHYSLGKSPMDATYRQRRTHGDPEAFRRIDLMGLLEKIKPWLPQNDITAAFARAHSAALSISGISL